MEEQVLEFVVKMLTEKMNFTVDTDLPYRELRLGQGGLELDSLAFVEVVIHVEGEYGVRFTDSDFETIAQATLQDFSREVARKILAQQDSLPLAAAQN